MKTSKFLLLEIGEEAEIVAELANEAVIGTRLHHPAHLADLLLELQSLRRRMKELCAD